MGVFNYPRIHFRGTFTINPATADNDGVVMEIDAANVLLLPAFAAKSDADALAWLKAGVSAISIVNQNKFTYLRGGWNPFGDLTTEFVDVRVCSVIGSDGRISQSDPLIGSSLSVNGTPPTSEDEPPISLPKVCDLDPLGSAVTQLFLGGFEIGDVNLGLNGTCNRKAFSRWVAYRNATPYPGEQNFPGAGAVWQFTIPKECLSFYLPKMNGSPVLVDLQTAANAAKGIVVQFATFQVVPTLTDPELIASLADPASTTDNPATGLIVGSVGVWNDGEPATTPDGRLLLPPDDEALLVKKAGPAAGYLGAATAHVQGDRNVVSLNLIATFPENGYELPLTKADFGRVRLGVIPEGEKKPIAISDPIDYDYRTYALVGGILDVEFNTDRTDSDTLRAGTLVLLTDPDPDGDRCSILIERPRVITVMSVGKDDTGVYLDINDEVEMSIVVTERGGPPTENVTVYLSEFQYVTDPGDSQTRAISILHEVGAGVVTANRLQFDKTVEFNAGQTDPLVIPVTGLAAGGAVIAFTLDETPPTGPYPWGTARYAGFRVLPNDDYCPFVGDKKMWWDFMYNNVFRYYRLIFPAMSNHVPFDNESAMEDAAESIYEMTSLINRESTRFMPVSRDLSTGKKKLIKEWYEFLKAQPAVKFTRRFWP